MAGALRRNFAYSAGYQLVNVAVPIVLTPYLSRTIGVEGNGNYSYTQSIANYFVLFAQLGIVNYGVREIARCGEDRDLRSQRFAEIFSMNFAWGAFVLLLYVLYVGVAGGQAVTLGVLWIFWLVAAVLDPTWLLNGCGEFKVPMVRSMVTRIASVVVIFGAVQSSGDTWVYVLASAVAYFLNAVMVWPFVWRYVDWRRLSVTGAMSHFRPNLLLFVPVIAVSLYTLLDRIMLGVLAGMGEVGIYDYSEKVAKMPLAVVTALGAVVLPRMTQVLSRGRNDDARMLVRRTMWFMEAVGVGLAFGIASVATDFVPVFFGPGYDRCAGLMVILAGIIPLIVASNVIGIQYLVPAGRDRAFTVSVLVGAAVNVTLNLVLIPRYGALAAAAATLVTELVVVVIQAVLVRGDLNLGCSVRDVLPFFGMGLVMMVSVRGLSSVLGACAATGAGVALEVAFGAFVYGLVFVVWNVVSRNENFLAALGR